jgi:hypothetical protein
MVGKAVGTYGELARLVVDADVSDVHRVGRGRDGGAARRAQHTAHEGREGALLLVVQAPALGAVSLIAVAVARALDARGRSVHLAGKLLERRRLAQAGAFLEARRLRAVSCLGMHGPRRAKLLLLLLLLGAVGCGVGARDAERLANEVGAGGQDVRGVLIVEAVCAACIHAAILRLGDGRQQRPRAMER